jgi:hypothetical protein
MDVPYFNIFETLKYVLKEFSNFHLLAYFHLAMSPSNKGQCYSLITKKWPLFHEKKNSNQIMGGSFWRV